MNSQNTPVHIRLWHRSFWLMAIATMLLTMSVYMLVPTLPEWLLSSQSFSPVESGLAIAAFGVGLFAMGPFVSFLVQHYRRNVVCIWAMIIVGGLIGLLYSIECEHFSFAEWSIILIQRLALGAAFGLAQMVLTSTLIIDTSESFQRTEANHSAAWFSRFALSLGPFAGLLISRLAGFDVMLLAAMGCAFVSAMLVMFVSFPFRSPEEHISVTSLDRFFLPHGSPLFLNLQLITLILGIVLSVASSELFFAMLMAGFLMAILAQRFAFRDAEVKSEVITGLILIFAALLMMLTRTQTIVGYAAPAMIGMGIGIIGSRFLLFFIKLSRHCQRGTSHSTFLLGWESGIVWGLGLGVALFYNNQKQALVVAILLIVVSLVMYNFTHNWFLKNKNR